MYNIMLLQNALHENPNPIPALQSPLPLSIEFLRIPPQLLAVVVEFGGIR